MKRRPTKMAPGFWGNPTSTLDWCEKNYEVKDVFGYFDLKCRTMFIFSLPKALFCPNAFVKYAVGDDVISGGPRTTS